MPQYSSPYDPEKGPYVDVYVSLPASLYPEEDVKNSRTKLTMLIDTGASKTAISTRVAHKLGLQPEGKRKMTLANGEIEVNVYYVDLECEHVFPTIYKPTMEVVEFPLDQTWRDGLIGRDFLKTVSIEINAPQGTFKLVT